MPLVLDATAGGAGSNSYSTRAEADAYFLGSLYAADWTAASTTTKEQALVQATRRLDALVEWTGRAATDTQALAWPRYGMYNRNGFVIAPTEIPAALKAATSELALELIGADPDAPSESAGLKGLKAGPVELEFDTEADDPEPLSDRVWSLLVSTWGYVRARSANQVALVRG